MNYNTAFVPQEVSMFIPYIDGSYTYEDIVYELQDKMELGLIDRIEMVPKVGFNEKTGHTYKSCFVYFWHWGNGYNSQYVYQQMKANIPSKLYVAMDRYWVILPNKSKIASLPLPRHISFKLILGAPLSVWGLNAVSLEKLFLDMDIGHVCTSVLQENKITYRDSYTQEHASYFEVDVTMNYWHHSRITHEIQQILCCRKAVYLDIVNMDGVPLTAETLMEEGRSTEGMLCLILDDQPPKTSGANPYIWYARDTDHPLNCKHVHM